MSLTNSQYQSIIQSYDNKQLRNQHQANMRLQHIYSSVDGYKDLDDSISSLCVSCGRKLLDGDTASLEGLHANLADLKLKREQLLLSSGYPSNYLEPTYDCPLCKDTGYISPTEKCTCFKRSIVSFLYDQSNLSEVMKTENFEHLSYDYFQGENLDRFKENVKTSKEFIINFNSDYQNLLFYGTVGTGKSFLSGCIAKSLIDSGHSVIYFSASGFFDLLSKYSFDYKNREILSDLYDNIYTCDLLIIDDLGTELTNTFTTSQLFSCINERNIRKKSLLISTNLSFAEIRDRYSDRIFSRITSNFKINKFTGPDIRVLG